MGWSFVDLDEQFISSIGDIASYIKSAGYEAYVAQNAALCRELIESYGDRAFLMVLSSGFLATDVLPDIVAENRRHIQSKGRAILLLPSLDESEAEEIVVSRQMARGFNLNESKERAKFRERFHEYQKIPSELIVSAGTPSQIATQIVELVARQP
ncbi:hypothetical protein A6U97_27850 [Agrobacterium tumefaciens]|nr:hypothetical protein A6U97_27850 [Agrobacterium tumefaciens]